MTSCNKKGRRETPTKSMYVKNIEALSEIYLEIAKDMELQGVRRDL